MSARILAHGIGGGWDLRHEGCAPKCCEAEAEVVDNLGAAVLRTFQFDAHRREEPCAGCGARLEHQPAPMDFARDEPCEEHACASPPCGRGEACEGVGICADCSGVA